MRSKKLKFKQKRKADVKNKETVFFWESKTCEEIGLVYRIENTGGLAGFSFNNKTFCAFRDLTNHRVELLVGSNFENCKKACQENLEKIIRQITRLK